MNRLFTLLLLFAVASQEASAQQKNFDVARGESEWDFTVGWADHKGKKRRVEFSMPADAINGDLGIPLRFQSREANEDILKAINAYTKSLKGVQIKAVQMSNGSIRLSGQGNKRKLKQAAAGIQDVQKQALRTYMKKHGFTKLKGKVIPNHAQHAYRYADDVAPLAEALGDGEMNRRQFAARALSYVQSIPYEKGRGGRDKGFRPPLSLLAKNKGDCDSKATLYLALLKAAHPRLDTSFIYISGHAFVGLGLKPRDGDMTFEADGRRWVIAEPVGPAMVVVGDADKQSKRKARQGKIGIRRVKDD